jgi:hypothetical protein
VGAERETCVDIKLHFGDVKVNRKMYGEVIEAARI